MNEGAEEFPPYPPAQPPCLELFAGKRFILEPLSMSSRQGAHLEMLQANSLAWRSGLLEASSIECPAGHSL